jgi:hypothetical protein
LAATLWVKEPNEQGYTWVNTNKLPRQAGIGVIGIEPISACNTTSQRVAHAVRLSSV